jgi:hypothetical protein
MAFRPNFRDTVRMSGDSMVVTGQSDGDPVADDIRVYIEQKRRVARGSVATPAGAWQASLTAEGFSPGPALAFGVEIRTDPFLTTTWSQMVTIE